MTEMFGRLEYAPGFSPTNLPADIDYVTLGDVRDASWSRGRQDETAAMEPGQATFVVDDPNGTKFLQVVQGNIPPLTAVRMVIDAKAVDPYVYLSGTSGHWLSTPDAAALDVTSSIDIRVKASFVDWTPATTCSLLGKWHFTGNQRSYRLDLSVSGLVLYVSPDGVAGATSATSSVVVPFAANQAGWVRATWNNATDTARFYTSTNGVDWTQLGSDVSLIATGIYSGNQPVGVGAISGGTSQPMTGNVYRAEVRNGVDGTVVASFDAADFAERSDLTCVSSITGEVWTLNRTNVTSYLQLAQDYVRFTGFMVDAPQPSGSRAARVLTVSAFDWLGWAASVDGPTSKWAAYIGEYRPPLWLRNDAIGGSPMNYEYEDRVVNVGTAGADGDLRARPDPLSGYPMYLDANETSPVPDETGFMWSSGYSSTGDILGDVDIPMSGGTAFSFGFWFKALTNPSGTVDVIRVRNTAGDYLCRFSINTSGHMYAHYYDDDGTTSSQGMLVDICDGVSRLFIISLDPSSAFPLEFFSSAGSLASGAPGLWSGNTITNAHIEILSSDTFAFWWQDIFSITSAIDITWGDWVTTVPALWTGDTPAERATRLAASVGVVAPTIQDHTDTATPCGTAASFGGSLADPVQELAESRLGTAWITAGGALRIRGYSSLIDNAYATQYRTDLASLTDADLEVATPAIWGDFVWGDFVWGGPDIDLVRRNVQGTTAGRLDRIINQVRITDTTGFSLALREQASVDQFGLREQDVATDISVTGRKLDAAARDLLARRSYPGIEVGTVTVEPWTTDEAALLVLNADLEQAVHFHESQWGATVGGVHPDPLVYGSFRIMRESWSWRGNRPTVTYNLEAITLL